MFIALFYYFALVMPNAPAQSWLIFMVIPLFMLVKSMVDAAIIERYMRRYDEGYRWHLRYNLGKR